MKKGNLTTDHIRITCLDEADEMLSMGFVEDVRKILRQCPKESQTLLFSATVSAETERLVEEFLSDPEQIYLSTDMDNVETITHVIYEAPHEMHKAKALLYLLDMEDPRNAIIFCNTRSDASTEASFLDRQAHDAHQLSGELAQTQRTRVMNRIKSGQVRFLSPQIASRGIDISNLTHVINYVATGPQDILASDWSNGSPAMGTAIIGERVDLSAKKVLRPSMGSISKRSPSPVQRNVFRIAQQQARQIQSAMGTMVFESPTSLPWTDCFELDNGKALLAAALRAFFQWIASVGQRCRCSERPSRDNGAGSSKKNDSNRRVDAIKIGNVEKTNAMRQAPRKKDQGGRDKGRKREGPRRKKASQRRRIPLTTLIHC